MSFSGIGLHTGEEVILSFCPAPENSGISFQRLDLPGKPVIPANVLNVQATARATTIGVGEACVHTVEHVLSAARAMQIDNLLVQLTAAEPPIADGSSEIFIRLLDSAEVVDQVEKKTVFDLQNPIAYSNGETHLVAVPYDGFRISYTLHYPDCPAMGTQYHSIEMSTKSFVDEIMSCRTFSLYEEITFLLDRGLIKGASLDNGVVVKGDVVLSKDGLKFPNEMARHKILDLLGDLALVGVPFRAHVMAVRSGHASNVVLAKKIHEHLAPSLRESHGR